MPTMWVRASQVCLGNEKKVKDESGFVLTLGGKISPSWGRSPDWLAGDVFGGSWGCPEVDSACSSGDQALAFAQKSNLRVTEHESTGSLLKKKYTVEREMQAKSELSRLLTLASRQTASTSQPLELTGFECSAEPPGNVLSWICVFWVSQDLE